MEVRQYICVKVFIEWRTNYCFNAACHWLKLSFRIGAPGPGIDTYHAWNVTTLSRTNSEYVQIANSLLDKPDVLASTWINIIYTRVCAAH